MGGLHFVETKQTERDRKGIDGGSQFRQTASDGNLLVDYSD